MATPWLTRFRLGEVAQAHLRIRMRTAHHGSARASCTDLSAGPHHPAVCLQDQGPRTSRVPGSLQARLTSCLGAQEALVQHACCSPRSSHVCKHCTLRKAQFCTCDIPSNSSGIISYQLEHIVEQSETAAEWRSSCHAGALLRAGGKQCAPLASVLPRPIALLAANAEVLPLNKFERQ